MRRRQERCRGCGQMLAAVPAGGGWAHLSPTLPVSGSSPLWRRRQMESGGSLLSPRRASSVRSALAPSPDLRGTVPAEHGDGARHSALRHHRGQLLTERGRPVLISTANALLPPRGRLQQLQLCFGVLAEWRHFFIQNQTYPLVKDRVFSSFLALAAQ